MKNERNSKDRVKKKLIVNLCKKAFALFVY